MMTIKQQEYQSWSLVSLEDLAVSEKGSIRRGPFGGSLKKEIFVNDGYLVYEQQHAIADDFSLGRYFIDEVKYKEMEGFNVLPDDLIISCAGTIGKIAIAPDDSRPGIINQALMRIRPDRDKILPIYLKRYLESPIAQREIFSKSSGSALKNLVAISEIKKSKIPLPPLEEQKRIVAILDKADRVRRKRQEAIRLTEELGRSIFLDMFGDPVTNPKEWEEISLGKISKVQGGLQITPKRKVNNLEVPYLRVANVYRDKLNLEEIKLISVTEQELTRTALEKGDLLIVEGHGNNQEIGRSSVWDGSIANCVHQNHLIRVRVDGDKADPYYVSNFLNSAGGRRQLTKCSKTTSGLNTISSSNVKAIQILLPPIEKQKKYIELQTKILAGYKKLSLHSSDSENLFNSLLQRAFRGEL
jgi:type I restriction enzyme, S subunit